MLARWLLILAGVIACAFAEQPERPPCNKQNRGMVWPEPRTQNTCTEVQVCTRAVRKYRWESVTVHVSQLPKDPKQRSACESTSAPSSVTAGGGAEPPTTNR